MCLIEPATFSAETHVPMTTPLLAVSVRLRCTTCGERRVHVRPEPYLIC
jgi:hypothetical protein